MLGLILKTIEVMKDKRLDELKKNFDLEEIPSELEKSINIEKSKKLHIKKADMEKIIKNQEGRLDDVLASFLHKKDDYEYKILTEFPDLDKLMGGLRLGELVIVGGRPSQGKTSFLLSLARNISFRENPTPVLYINLESTLYQTAERLNLMIENDKVLHKIPFYLSAPKKNIETILEIIHHYIISQKVKVIFIDYIQLLQISDERQRNRELTSTIKSLKELAEEQQISIVIASQMNRSIELRSGLYGRPFLSDLRDSGALEQESDKIIFLQRPEYYGILEDENGDSTRDVVEVILAKNRSGATGEIMLKMQKETVSFECWPKVEYNWGGLDTDLVF